MKNLIVALLFLTCYFAKSQEYTVTPAVCENTTNLTTVFSATIDSNWQNHREISFFMNIENRQNSGTSQNLKVILYVQGIADTLVNATVSNNTTTGRHFVTGRMYRDDSIAYVGKGTLAFNGAPTPVDDFSGAAGNGAIIQGVDFNSAITVEIAVQWGTNSNVLYRVVSGRLVQL